MTHFVGTTAAIESGTPQRRDGERTDINVKRPVYVLCNGQDAFCGHASTALGAKRIASKYGYQTKGNVSVSAQGRFVVMSSSFEGKV